MLNTELTRLKEEDMKKIQERAKRLQMRKKTEIIEREMKSSQLVLKQKSSTSRMSEISFVSQLKKNKQTSEYCHTLDKWGSSGFSLQRSPKKNAMVI